MISLIVTAYEDPKSTKESIKRLLNQEDFHEKFELIAACPDEPTKRIIMDYKKKYPLIIRYVKQEYGSGKNRLMNKIITLVKGDIIVWTDGNKFVERDAIKRLLEPFQDSEVGCAGGRPIPINNKNNLFGFWAHLLTNAAHKMREQRFLKGKFVEQCANLLAMRAGIINEIPEDVAEDAIIPYLITKEGYKNVYVGTAIVSVMYPQNFKDWTKQKIRSAKSHEALNKYIDSKDIKQKSFLNEITNLGFTLSPFKNIKEFYWMILLYFSRLYIWLKAFYEIKIRKEHYNPDWSRSESTKILEYIERK